MAEDDASPELSPLQNKTLGLLRRSADAVVYLTYEHGREIQKAWQRRCSAPDKKTRRMAGFS